jgi:aspartate racemase
MSGAARATLTVGVLGGMGPAATLDFFAKVIEATAAEGDQDHIRLVIDSNPGVPNRNEAVAGVGPSPGPVLADMARGLELAGADFLVMVCNAAHAWQAEIEAATLLPFVSLIAETVALVRRKHLNVKRVGVLAASGCLDAQLYQQAFANAGVEVLVPESAFREWFMEVLYRIKAGEATRDTREEMRAISEDLTRRGAELVIAGCTEVPLVLSAHDIQVPLINSTDVLVERTLAYARREAPLPVRR